MEVPMSDTIFKIKQIVSVIVFIGVLSLMGSITKQPLMILAYAVFFAAVMAVMFFLMRKRQRHYDLTKGANPLFRKIIGGVLMVAALAAPVLITVRSTIINLPATLSLGAVIGIVLGITVVFIALVLVALHLINNKGSELSMRIIGYVLFIIGAAIPGIMMSRIDKTTTSIGSVYYVALAVLVLAYNGYGYLLNKE